MANRSAYGFLQVSGENIDAYDASGGTFNSDWVQCNGDWVLVHVKVTESGGTSPTLDCALELSMDGGTTIVEFPEDNNSETQASLAQFTVTSGDDEKLKFWLQPLPQNSDEHQWRVVFTTGGTLSTYDVTAKYAARTTAEELR